MGISGLLPALKSIQRTTHVREHAGKRVAVDAYCWLHRGAYCCSRELVLGIPTDKHIAFCLERLRMLKDHNIKVTLVFDGGRLPSKAGENAERSRCVVLRRFKQPRQGVSWSRLWCPVLQNQEPFPPSPSHRYSSPRQVASGESRQGPGPRARGQRRGGVRVLPAVRGGQRGVSRGDHGLQLGRGADASGFSAGPRWPSGATMPDVPAPDTPPFLHSGGELVPPIPTCGFILRPPPPPSFPIECLFVCSFIMLRPFQRRGDLARHRGVTHRGRARPARRRRPRRAVRSRRAGEWGRATHREYLPES